MPWLLRILGAVASAAFSLGCYATQPPLTPPERGGPPWVELTTRHFRLLTDVDRATADQAIASLEASHTILAVVTHRPPRMREVPLDVVLFSRTRDFKAVASETAGAYFKPSLPLDLEPRPVIVMHDSEVASEARLVVQHELTHRFVHERFAIVPKWLDEGLAEYYSSARVEGDGVVLGAPAGFDFSDRADFWISWAGDRQQLQIPRRFAPKVRVLVELDAAGFYVNEDALSRQGVEARVSHYGGAWRLVHLLLNGPNASYRSAFLGYLASLQRGTPAREAFDASFGAFGEQIEQDYRAYLDAPPRWAVARAKGGAAELSAGSPAPLVRTLAPAEVHVLWARLLPLSAAAPELKAARDADPASIDARLATVTLKLQTEDIDAAKLDLDELLAAAPNEPRALHALLSWHALHAPGSPPPEDLVARLAEVATTPAELAAAATGYGARGLADRGLPLAERALRTDPTSWVAARAVTSLLEAAGRHEEARAAAARAASLAPEAERRRVLPVRGRTR